jgi:hypothetical protein
MLTSATLSLKVAIQLYAHAHYCFPHNLIFSFEKKKKK